MAPSRLNLHSARIGARWRQLVYKKGDPQYARIYSHLGGIRPGEHKPVPAFLLAQRCRLPVTAFQITSTIMAPITATKVETMKPCIS